MTRFVVLLLCLLTLGNLLNAQSDTVTQVTAPPAITVEASISVGYLNENGEELLEITTDCSQKLIEGKATFSINGKSTELLFKDCRATTKYPVEKGKLILISKGSSYDDYTLVHISPKAGGSYRIKLIPLWLSILPPLVAIILALVFKEVVISLFLGIWAGAIVVNGLRFDPISLILGFYDVITKYIIGALTDSGHMSVVVFSLMIGGMVAIISRNGGMAGIVVQFSKYAKTAKSTQFVTWLLGIAIFFDDYANTLIVGNTMRSATDKYKISREKLAYIVDSTAAPVSAIAFITTWIGVELGYIKDSFHDLAGIDVVPSAYSVFLSSLQYSFYPILTLIFILFIIFTGRDYGTMHAAEVRARTTGEVANKRGEKTEEGDMEDLEPVKGAKLRWYNAAIPVLTVILVTILGLASTGMESSFSALSAAGHEIEESWSAIWANLNLLSQSQNISFFERLGILVGNADSYIALLWASLSGMVVGLILTVGGRIMSIIDSMNTMIAGFKTMMPAIMILALAWSLGEMTEELHTATFLTSTLQNTLPPTLMPVVIFIFAGAIAFSTGSSWSTMAILYPIAIPATWAICMANGLEIDYALTIEYNVIATVLAASVFGDHCSPISDTTILSSLASDCNHIDHVSTQLPYALTVGSVSIILGYASTAFGLPAFVSFGIGIGVLWGVVRLFGKPVE